MHYRDFQLSWTWFNIIHSRRGWWILSFYSIENFCWNLRSFALEKIQLISQFLSKTFFISKIFSVSYEKGGDEWQKTLSIEQALHKRLNSNFFSQTFYVVSTRLWEKPVRKEHYITSFISDMCSNRYKTIFVVGDVSGRQENDELHFTLFWNFMKGVCQIFSRKSFLNAEMFSTFFEMLLTTMMAVGVWK